MLRLYLNFSTLSICRKKERVVAYKALARSSVGAVFPEGEVSVSDTHLPHGALEDPPHELDHTLLGDREKTQSTRSQLDDAPKAERAKTCSSS